MVLAPWFSVKYPDCTYQTITAADEITGRKSTAHPTNTFVNMLTFENSLSSLPKKQTKTPKISKGNRP